MTGSRIPGVERRRLEPHTDPRGTLRELWRRSLQPIEVHQALVTSSSGGALRGMHYHLRQSDICYVASGRVYLALMDLRVGKPATEQFWLDQDESVLIPPGVGHGYATEAGAVVIYLLTTEVDGSDEYGFRYDDPAADIRWPVSDPKLSARDRDARTLAEAQAHVRGELGARSAR